MEKILVYGMTSNRGGVEAYILSLFRNMDHSQIQFDFMVDFPEMAYAEEVLAAGAKIHYIPSKSAHPLRHLRAFKKILKAHPEYKAVYFNILNAGAAFTMTMARQMKRKIIVHSHNGRDDNMRLHRIFQPLLLKYADVRLACSKLAAEYMFGSCTDVTVINNAIKIQEYVYSPEKRAEKRAQLGLVERTFTVLHAGRITTQKNPLFLLHVFAEIQKRRPDSVLLYAGTGDMEAQAHALARELGIADKVRFLGMRSDVNELYQAADVFLLPSLYEGLSIVLIEAQTAGLRTFGSDANSPDAIITHLLSYISLERSPAQWAEEIVSAEIAPRRDMSALIEAAGYSIDSTVKKTTDILLHCLSEK